jgi:hypothetical protein
MNLNTIISLRALVVGKANNKTLIACLWFWSPLSDFDHLGESIEPCRVEKIFSFFFNVVGSWKKWIWVAIVVENYVHKRERGRQRQRQRETERQRLRKGKGFVFLSLKFSCLHTGWCVCFGSAGWFLSGIKFFLVGLDQFCFECCTKVPVASFFY